MLAVNSLIRSSSIVCVVVSTIVCCAVCPNPAEAQLLQSRKRRVSCFGGRATIRNPHQLPAVPFGDLYYALPLFVGPHIGAAGVELATDRPAMVTAVDSQYQSPTSHSPRPVRVLNPAFYDSVSDARNTPGTSGGKRVGQAIQFPIIHTLEPARRFQLDAETAFRSGRYRDALTLVEQAIKVDPLNGLLKLFSSQANFASRRYRIAARELDAATRLLDPDEWDFFGQHFRAFYGRNDYVTQTEALLEQAQRRPDDYQLKVLLGYHYGIAGHRQSATEYFHEALRLNPQDALTQRLVPAIGDPHLPMAAGNSIEAPSPKFASTRIQNYNYHANRTRVKRIYLTSQFTPPPFGAQRFEGPMSGDELIEAPGEVFIPQLDGPAEAAVIPDALDAEHSVLEELPEPLEEN